jgi:two-component system, cell cycle response regulator
MPKRRNASRKAAATLRVPHLPAFPESRRVASLLVVQGSHLDLGRHILCDRPITIGRDEEAELSLNDGSISRQHCCVKRDQETGHYILIDLGSTNGTAVNGYKVDQRYPLTEGDKVFLGASVVRFSFADAVDLAYQTRLAEMVSTDALTGMSTKRQYDAVFEACADRAATTASPLAVLVMDMDGLKQINDTHGHEMGGFVIVEVARIIRAVLEPHGTLCRFGGDEFVACLPDMDHRGALALAEELRGRVEAHSFVHHGTRVEPTLSVGVAAYPEDIDDPGQLFAVADRALYKAKHAGRNKVAGAD